MKKIKVFISLFLTILSSFTIGLYASSMFKFNQPIDLHRWITTIIFGTMSLVYFLTEFKKK